MRGVIFNIQRDCIHDGPGIRTNVFFKGCPLRCQWCCNPESQNCRPELAWLAFRCVKCYQCVSNCLNGALTVGGHGELHLDRDKCDLCGACVSCCPKGAWKLYGEVITDEEVLRQALRDEMFFRKSGGGVTFTGGEPLMQPQFLQKLIDGAKRHGIHVAIETSGQAAWSLAGPLLEQADYIMVDIKHMNSETHRRLTGIDNRVILQNIEQMVRRKMPVICRIPLISGINDGEQNLRETARFIRSVGKNEVVLLPFHQYGAVKYGYLMREYALTNLKAASDVQVEAAKSILQERLQTVTVGGDGLPCEI